MVILSHLILVQHCHSNPLRGITIPLWLVAIGYLREMCTQAKAQETDLKRDLREAVDTLAQLHQNCSIVSRHNYCPCAVFLYCFCIPLRIVHNYSVWFPPVQ